MRPVGIPKAIAAIRMRSPFFDWDLLHCVDSEIPLGDEFLQPSALTFEFAKALHIGGFHGAEALASGVNRLLANGAILGCGRHRISVSFSENLYDLLFAETPTRDAQTSRSYG